jgi:predicted membrane protein
MDAFISSKLFWGAIVVIVGLVIIANAIFNINIPVFKVLLGIFFIYLGVKMLLELKPNSVNNSSNVSVFNEGSFEGTTLDDKEFSAVFGKQTIDLRTVEFPNISKIEVNAVFGSSTLYLPQGINAEIEQTAVFGSVYDRRNALNQTGDKILKIEANAVFGKVVIIQ